MNNIKWTIKQGRGTGAHITGNELSGGPILLCTEKGNEVVWSPELGH